MFCDSTLDRGEFEIESLLNCVIVWKKYLLDRDELMVETVLDWCVFEKEFSV